MCFNFLNVQLLFTERWTRKAKTLDSCGGRHCSRGAHACVWQNWWKWSVMCVCLCVEIDFMCRNWLWCNVHNTANLCLFSRRHKAWSTAVVFSSCIWACGAQSTGTARWGWWVQQKVQSILIFTFFGIYFIYLFMLFSFFRWLSRIYRS